MKAKQFEIWIADLNPKIGTEPGKIRPVIILQTDLLNKVHSSVIICPLTTNIQIESEILRVHLKQSTSHVSEDCDIMMDQIRAIDCKRLQTKIGIAPKEAIAKIKENLRIILDLS